MFSCEADFTAAAGSKFTEGAAAILVLVLLITGEGNQACYPIKYKNLIN